MIAKTLAAAALMTVLAAPAFAAMDCGGMLDKHSDMIGKMTKSSAEKRAALRRMALSGYDTCMAGDEFNATKFFEMIAREHN